MTWTSDCGKATVFCGDTIQVMRTMSDASVQTCVTSPPYFGLRDYGTAKWEGGNIACDHKVPLCKKGGNAVGTKQTTNSGSYGYREWLVCGKCGARRIDSQIGLEATPDEYIAKMVDVFREVRRLLRDDGTCWINIGDSYNAQPGQRKTTDKAGEKQASSIGSIGAPSRSVEGLKPKDLIGIPWMLAFALRADGWYLRQDIIWHKPNPMPESVTDRCTKSHEYIFMLSKIANYYYDQKAIAEPAIYAGLLGQDESGYKDATTFEGKHALRSDKQRGHSRRHAGFNDRWDVMEKTKQCSGTRNKRSVWTVAPASYPGAHFATYPPELIEPCILAGAPVGGVVLDPFNGSGTTGEVALQHGRRYVGIELNPEYVELTKTRIGKATESFALIAPHVDKPEVPLLFSPASEGGRG